MIRKPQMDALGASLRRRFELQLYDVFFKFYPRECRQVGGRDAVLRWINLGVKSAEDAGFTSQYQCGRWLMLMLMLGVDFVCANGQLLPRPWSQRGMIPNIGV